MVMLDKKSQGITQVMTFNREGDMNLATKFHGNQTINC